VLAGRIAAGTRLPATRELADDLGVARGTVAQAYELLLAEGFIRGEVGRGTFVSDDLGIVRKTATRTKRKLDIPLSRRGRVLASSPYPLAGATTTPVPFAPFLPALREFPHKTWQRLAIATSRQLKIRQMMDGDTQGYAPLRHALKDYLRVARGVRCDAHNIFVFSSTMQALDACLRLFADVGDGVACEDPCYRGASALFRSNGLTLHPIAVDDQGMDVRQLPAKNAGIRLVYVTPAHQAPLGSVLSIARRLQLLAWAEQSSAIVFEDDYDGEYRYGGHPIPALQSHDEADVVFHAGTFSKTLFPALRLAYLVVPDAYVAPLAAARSMTSRYPNIADQCTLAAFIADGHFARHLSRMRRLYAERRDALNQLFRTYVGDAARLGANEAGLQTSCEFMTGGHEQGIIARMRHRRIDIRGIDDYRIKAKLPPMCVLGFAAFRPSELKSGVVAFSDVLAEIPR
jgi:GntR family transcriptional regulator/MocR family aminotransferase